MIALTIPALRSALRGIQRRSKDPIKKERIGTLLKQLDTLPSAFGEHKKRLERLIVWQISLLKAA